MESHLIVDELQLEKNENIGNKLEDFEILQTLGKGSYGFVAKVKSNINHKLYAMKMIDLSLLKEKIEIDFSINEIKIIQSLNSPHINKYYCNFNCQNKLYIIMEFMSNGDLKGFLNAYKIIKKPIPEDQIWELLYQSAAGLNYIHKNKLIHRDIKPANLFMTDDKTIKIGDFGVAAVKKTNQFGQFGIPNLANSKETLFIGTIGYMSPEMFNHTGYGKKVDVYALGVTFYELCYFNLPRKLVENFSPQGTNVYFEDIPPQSNANYYSKELYNLIQWMIQKDEKNRPSSSDVLQYIRKIYNAKNRQNSTIDCIYRCLFSFQNLTNYMKKQKMKVDHTANERPISMSFIYAIERMDYQNWPTKLNNLRDILTYQNSSLSDPGEIDPIDLMKFMLIEFHKESTINKNITPENPYFYSPETPSILNYDKSLQEYVLFSQNYKSCTADFFFGTYEITKFCNSCRNKKFYFRNFLYIIFNIDEALKNGLSENNSFLANYFLKQQSLIISNTIFCSICNKLALHQESKKFFTLPYNLIICFQGENQNYNNKFLKYPIRLDLSSLKLRSGMSVYNLKGVIKSYVNNGKKFYICIYEDFAKRNWFISDGYSKDPIISPLNHIMGDVVMLFYSSLN